MPTILFAAPLLGEAGLPAKKVGAGTQDSEYTALTAEQTPQTNHPVIPDPEEPNLEEPNLEEPNLEEPNLTESSPERLETIRAVSQYTDKVLQLEFDEGAYSQLLSEHLLGLGDAHTKLGNHEEALQAYQRALLINRSNQGLHNLGQKPILERLMATHEALGNHEGLDDNYNYLLWLGRRNYDSDKPSLLPTLIRVAAWKLEAFAIEPTQSSVDQLFEAKALFDQSLKIIENNPQMDDLKAIDHLYDIARENFSAGFFVASYNIGRDALQKIIDMHYANEELSRESLAEAWALMGDWELGFNKRGSATESYRTAYQLLSEDEQNFDAINRLFGQPRSLTSLGVPKMTTQLQQRISSDDQGSGSPADNSSLDGLIYIDQLINKNTEFVLAEFDVTSSGRVSNVDILRANPKDNVTFRRSARERISRVPFRPRLEDGKPVHTDNFVMLYKFQ